jgi:hypothetical protein
MIVVYRRKKCDETHPRCQSCTRLNLECTYQPTDKPPNWHQKSTMEDTPAHAFGRWRLAACGSMHQDSTAHIPSENGPSLICFSLESLSNGSTESQSSGISLIPISPPSVPSPLPSRLNSGSSTYSKHPRSSDTNLSVLRSGRPGDTQTTEARTTRNPLGQEPAIGPDGTRAVALVEGVSYDTPGFIHIERSNERWFQANRTYVSPKYIVPGEAFAPISNFQSFSDTGLVEPEWDDLDDPEGVYAILCRSPTLDASVSDNLLPFVLQNCESFGRYRI